MKYLHVVFFAFISFSVCSQKLDRNEKKIISIIDQSGSSYLNFLEETVNQNSGTNNLEGVRKVGEMYKSRFEAIGFATHWVEMPEEMKRAGHLFAEHSGKKGKRLLLIGHLDTVFEPTSSFQNFVKQDSIAVGPGANDMKGGNMILLAALESLFKAGLLKETQIIVALHGDEESAGKPIDISRKDIIDAAKRSDFALGFETATGFNYATVARRGSSGWTVTVNGKQAHSSGIFNDRTGAGANYEAARILHRFYEELQEENLTFNAGILAGGTEMNMNSTGSEIDVSGKSNIVANQAYIKGDLRFISEEQKMRTRKKMEAIVADNLPHTSATISFTDTYPAMPPTEGNYKLLEVLNTVSIDLGLGEVNPYDPGRRGAGDISFVAEYVDCLDGLGATGRGAHAPGESIDLYTINDLIKRTAILLYRLTR